MDSASGIALIWIAPLAAMLLVSFTYFRASPSNAPLGARLAVSAHGVAGAILFLVAPALALVGLASPAWRVPYLALWALPLALVAAALRWFPGPKWVHTLQLINIMAMAWAVVMGFTIAGGGK